MSNTLSLVQGTSLQQCIDLVGANDEPIPACSLQGASAVFHMRSAPTDTWDVLTYTAADNPANLVIVPDRAVLVLTVLPGDTSSISLGLYFYQVQLTLVDGTVQNLVNWNLIDLSLGGAAAVPPPPFINTVQIDENYQTPGALLYVTPGGSPICGAQIRVYYQSDYQAGNLSCPVGVTTTNAYGGFTNAILVQTGYSYVLRWESPGEWGPNVATITA